MSADIFSSWELTAQQSDLLLDMGLTKDQVQSLESVATQSASGDGGDQVEFSPEALAMALQFVQESEGSPSTDLSSNQENSDEATADDFATGAAISASSAMVGGGGTAGAGSSSDSDQIEELEEEIEELEQEILELRGKSDEKSKQELKVKESELAMKQTELAQLQSNEG